MDVQLSFMRWSTLNQQYTACVLLPWGVSGVEGLTRSKHGICTLVCCMSQRSGPGLEHHIGCVSDVLRNRRVRQQHQHRGKHIQQQAAMANRQRCLAAQVLDRERGQQCVCGRKRCSQLMWCQRLCCCCPVDVLLVGKWLHHVLDHVRIHRPGCLQPFCAHTSGSLPV